jgi:hypothetical protein
MVCGLYVLACPREDALARLILGDEQGRWTGVQVGYKGKPISSLFTSWKAYRSCLNPSGLSCLARQAVFSSGEGRLGILLEGLQEVVWAAN